MLATLFCDPITGRFICRDCWNQVHGTREEPVRKLADCHCGCKDGPENQARESAVKRAAKRIRKRLKREALEASPLRAFNPEYRKPF